jgi:hypothetical protein
MSGGNYAGSTNVVIVTSNIVVVNSNFQGLKYDVYCVYFTVWNL